MTSTIQVLPTEVVNLIAAGEVIDSFAAVVRELVENSLDAGATRIVVSLWPQQWRIRVADNGRGMTLEDLQQAATSHSTSKIRTCSDLWKISSLGFRGEALHSLTTLADLEIWSRFSLGNGGWGIGNREMENNYSPPVLLGGWRVAYSRNGEPILIEAAAVAPGTVVNVSNLFANWVVRREGLPNFASQMKAVQATIQNIALCHPGVTWQVWQNDRRWFSLSATANTAQMLAQIICQIRPNDLSELQITLPDTNPPNSTLHLLLGLPDRCHRHRPDWVRFAVNGRMVKLPELEQTILAAFYRTLPRARYPVCFLHLKISPEQIDWNRNPAKSEIYLKDLDYWLTQVSAAIEKAFQINSATITDAISTTRVSKLLKAAEENGGYHLNRSIDEHKNPNSLLQEAASTPTTLTSNPIQVVGQINHTYIVAQHPGGMWLVEQHIAHERVLYERLCDNWRLVPVEPALILYQLSQKQVLQLQRIGLEIEPFGEQLWAVRTIPAMLQQRDDCADAILELSKGGDLQSAQVAVACRSAIRNGTHLTLQEMQTLLDQWRNTRNPHTCPHGRPICLSLDEPALARFFRRNWVIGKSHGI